MTREDFNIEDIHCQMVNKIQRNNQLLRDIEGGAENDLMMLSTEEPYGSLPQLIQIMDEEIICGDMCSRRALNWGKGRPMPLQ